MGRTITTGVMFGGPMDGVLQAVSADEVEVYCFRAELKPDKPFEAAIHAGEVAKVYQGVYAWDGHSAKPRRYQWKGWRE